MFTLSDKSLEKLKDVHPDLKKVVHLAICLTTIDFAVIDGLRDFAIEKEYLADGCSKTLNSRHLTGHAVDLAPWHEGKYIEGNNPNNWLYFESIAHAMKAASETLIIPIEWGGDWDEFRDGYHFQLPWKYYSLK